MNTLHVILFNKHRRPKSWNAFLILLLCALSSPSPLKRFRMEADLNFCALSNSNVYGLRDYINTHLTSKP